MKGKKCELAVAVAVEERDYEEVILPLRALRIHNHVQMLLSMNALLRWQQQSCF